MKSTKIRPQQATRYRLLAYSFCALMGMISSLGAQVFSWPGDQKAAVSLTFDDARFSHPDVGLELFRELDTRVTFYVVPGAVQKRLDGWKDLVADGHEIGNHTVQHPCTGNFSWSREKALEDYTLAGMRAELLACNQQIKAMLGVTPRSFAYTCGNLFVGRGAEHRSYVPLVGELFTSGRGWLNEPHNDPGFVDMALLQGNEMDGKDFAEIKAMLEVVKDEGGWLVLAGHEIGEGGHQTTRAAMLRQLVAYLNENQDDFWLATVGEVSEYIHQSRDDVSHQLADKLTLAATFDQGVMADFALGNGHLFSAPRYDRAHDLGTANLLPEEVKHSHIGRSGKSLHFTRKSRSVLYFEGDETMNYSPTSWSGTVSCWLSLDPENDLAPGFTDPIQITDSGYDDAAVWIDFTKENPREFRFGAFGDREIWNPDNKSPDTNQVFLNRLIVAEDRPFNHHRWTHVCFTFKNLNSGESVVKFYVEGKMQGERQVTEEFTWNEERAKIFLGLSYVGYIDEVAVFSEALPPDEVHQLYTLTGGLNSLLQHK